MTYIANRPVRFDRNYAVGEIIPDGVIDPQMTKKLIGMGRIIRIADMPKPAEQEHEASPAGEHTEDAIEAEAEKTAEPAEYRCAVCGKTYASANALAAHSRVHKK